MMSLWDALRMNMMISYQELVRTFPSIDRMYVRYNFDAVANGELLRTHERLFKEGKLKHTGQPLPDKGPNWREPEFVKEKRYGVK